MATANIPWQDIQEEVVQLALDIFGRYETEVISDFNSFKSEVEADLEEWVTAAATGEITKDELNELVLGEKDLLKLHALKQTGLAKVALDEFSAGVFSILTKTIAKLIV